MLSAKPVGYSLTCSTVRGELISSPRRKMDLWVSTSDNWKASKPSSSLTLFSTRREDDKREMAVMLAIMCSYYVEVMDEGGGLSSKRDRKPIQSRGGIDVWRDLAGNS